MATINVSRQGMGTGPASGTFSTARTGAGSSITDSVTGNQASAVQYYFSTGRGGAHRIRRVFLYFDTSSITSTLSAGHIDMPGYSGSPDPNDTIMLKSTAFGGDGGTALSSSDFYSSIDYSTPYSTELTSYSSGNNEYTLTAAALADIKNNDHFTLAIVQHDNDYANSASGSSVADDINIAFGTTITLDYTVVSGYANDIKGIASANISKVNGVATASVSKVNGI